MIAQRWHQVNHRDWLAVDWERMQQKLAWSAFFKEYDVIIAPVFAVPAFLHDQSEAVRPFYTPTARTLDVDGEATPYHNNAYWTGMANACHLPATAFPAAVVDGLPVGLQCIGPEHGDFKTIAIAGLVSKLLQPIQLELDC
jgi:amidase